MVNGGASEQEIDSYISLSGSSVDEVKNYKAQTGTPLEAEVEQRISKRPSAFEGAREAIGDIAKKTIIVWNTVRCSKVCSCGCGCYGSSVRVTRCQCSARTTKKGNSRLRPLLLTLLGGLLKAATEGVVGRGAKIDIGKMLQDIMKSGGIGFGSGIEEGVPRRGEYGDVYRKAGLPEPYACGSRIIDFCWIRPDRSTAVFNSRRKERCSKDGEINRKGC